MSESYHERRKYCVIPPKWLELEDEPSSVAGYRFRRSIGLRIYKTFWRLSR